METCILTQRRSVRGCLTSGAFLHVPKISLVTSLDWTKNPFALTNCNILLFLLGLLTMLQWHDNYYYSIDGGFHFLLTFISLEAKTFVFSNTNRVLFTWNLAAKTNPHLEITLLMRRWETRRTSWSRFLFTLFPHCSLGFMQRCGEGKGTDSGHV